MYSVYIIEDPSKYRWVQSCVKSVERWKLIPGGASGPRYRCTSYDYSKEYY